MTEGAGPGKTESRAEGGRLEPETQRHRDSETYRRHTETRGTCEAVRQRWTVTALCTQSDRKGRRQKRRRGETVSGNEEVERGRGRNREKGLAEALRGRETGSQILGKNLQEFLGRDRSLCEGGAPPVLWAA